MQSASARFAHTHVDGLIGRRIHRHRAKQWSGPDEGRHQHQRILSLPSVSLCDDHASNPLKTCRGISAADITESPDRWPLTSGEAKAWSVTSAPRVEPNPRPISSATGRNTDSIPDSRDQMTVWIQSARFEHEPSYQGRYRASSFG